MGYNANFTLNQLEIKLYKKLLQERIFINAMLPSYLPITNLQNQQPNWPIALELYCGMVTL